MSKHTHGWHNLSIRRPSNYPTPPVRPPVSGMASCNPILGSSQEFHLATALNCLKYSFQSPCPENCCGSLSLWECSLGGGTELGLNCIGIVDTLGKGLNCGEDQSSCLMSNNGSTPLSVNSEASSWKVTCEFFSPVTPESLDTLLADEIHGLALGPHNQQV